MEEKRLIAELLFDLGLEVDSGTGRIKEQESNTFIQSGRKYIRVDGVGESASNSDMILDPFNDRIMASLFDYYCNKMEHDEDDPFYVSHYEDFTKYGMTYLSATLYKDDEKFVIETNRYDWVNRALRYVEAIKIINCSDYSHVYKYCR